MAGNQKFIDDSKQKEKKLHENRIKLLQEREKTKANREEKRLQLKNKVLKDFEPIRIWKDKNTIEENLAKFRTKKEKLAALKSQINMAKEHVTITATNRNLKQFSKNGKHLDIPSLIQNLLQLITLSNNNNEHELQTELQDLTIKLSGVPSTIVGKYIYHAWSEKTWEGKVISFRMGSIRLIKF
jgi:hypothetical protein